MIISASRRTDIPAYYTEWFINRINEGFLYVRNPMNIYQVSKINLSPEIVDFIVFWTKNPEPLLDKLDKLQDYNYYFQFTINSYDTDIEEFVPNKGKYVISTFKKLSDMIGKEKVIWRYDPILLNDKYSISYHLENFDKLAKQLSRPSASSIQTTSVQYSEYQREHSSFFFTIASIKNHTQKLLLRKKLIPSLGNFFSLGREKNFSPNVADARLWKDLKYFSMCFCFEV